MLSYTYLFLYWSISGSVVKNLSRFNPWAGRSLGEGNGNPLQYLAWKIPGTEEPGGLQSVGSQRVRHDWVAFTHSLTHSQHTEQDVFVTGLWLGPWSEMGRLPPAAAASSSPISSLLLNWALLPRIETANDLLVGQGCSQRDFAPLGTNTATPWGRHSHTHFLTWEFWNSDGKIRALRSCLICPRSHSWHGATSYLDWESCLQTWVERGSNP